MTAHSQTARTDIKRTYQGKWGLTEGLGMKVNNHERGEGEYENQWKWEKGGEVNWKDEQEGEIVDM